MAALPPAAVAGGAGGATTYDALLRADRAWRALREAPVGAAAGPAPQFVREHQTPLGAPPTCASPALPTGGSLTPQVTQQWHLVLFILLFD